MKHIPSILLVLLLTAATAIPAKAELKPYPLDTIQGEVVYRYTAEKSVGLYRISVNFGCTQADIIRLNPQLKERGLHLDEILFIPVPAEDLVASAPLNITSPKGITSASITSDSITSPKGITSASITSDSITSPKGITSASLTSAAEIGDALTGDALTSEAKKIALLLPLQATAIERNAQMDRFVDFYEGALLAIHDVQQAGQKIDLKVFDTNKSLSEMRSILASGELNDRQIVVGPAYPALVETAAVWAQAHHVPFVVPFTNQVPSIEHNPYLIQFNAATAIEADSLAAYIHRQNMRVIFVHGNDADLPEGVRQLRRAVLAAGVDTVMTTIHTILTDSLATAIHGSQRHLLVLNTEKYQNMSILLPAIERTAESHPLTLLAQYSWPVDRIRMPLIYPSVFSTDLPADTKHYDQLYQQYFHHLHSSLRPRYDLLGYDLMRWTLAHLMGTEYFGLQSDIRMEKVGENGGWRNTYIRVIEK